MGGRFDRRAVREALQTVPVGVEDICMSRFHQFDRYGRSPQPVVPRTTPPKDAFRRKLRCAKCAAPLDGHEMFGECFPTAHLGESLPLTVRNGRLVAV
jgi:hypothetical protein